MSGKPSIPARWWPWIVPPARSSSRGWGPWRVKDGVTQLERRTIVIVPSTELMRLKRATGVAPSGWPGDFVESAFPEWQVKPGDWVTVAVKPDGTRMTAIRIDVADPGEL